MNFSKPLRKLLDRIESADDECLEFYLSLEKERRGISKYKLSFVSALDLAEYHFCQWKALRLGYENELNSFGVYLWNRLRTGAKLGYFQRLPRDKEKLLEQIGKLQLTKEKINKILRESNERESVRIWWDEPTLLTVLFPYPEPRSPRRENPYTYLPPYYSLGWGFDIDGLVVAATPTGISSDTVYIYKEFTSKRAISNFDILSRIEGDIYGYLYGRKRKVVELVIVESNRCLIFDEEVDEKLAENLLNSFKESTKHYRISLPPSTICESCNSNVSCQLKKYCA